MQRISEDKTEDQRWSKLQCTSEDATDSPPLNTVKSVDKSEDQRWSKIQCTSEDATESPPLNAVYIRR